MAFSVEEVQNHETFRLISECREIVEKVPSEKKSEHIDRWSRFEAIFRFSVNNIEKSDKALIPSHHLGNASSFLQSMKQNIQNFYNDGNTGHLDNAIADVSKLAHIFQTVYRYRFQQPYESQLDSVLKNYKDFVADIKNQHDSINKNIDKIKRETETKLEEIKNKASNLENNINQIQAEANSKIEAIDAQAVEAESRRETKFQEKLQEHNESIKNSIAEAENEIERIESTRIAKSRNLLRGSTSSLKKRNINSTKITNIFQKTW